MLRCHIVVAVDFGRPDGFFGRDCRTLRPKSIIEIWEDPQVVARFGPMSMRRVGSAR